MTKTTKSQQEANLEVELRALDRQDTKGSYLSKKSYLCGWIDLYAPDAPEAEWTKRPWKLKIEKDPETGIAVTYRLKPEHAYEAFTHNGLVPYRDAWIATPAAMPAKLVPRPTEANAE